MKSASPTAFHLLFNVSEETCFSVLLALLAVFSRHSSVNNYMSAGCTERDTQVAAINQPYFHFHMRTCSRLVHYVNI